MIGCKGAVTPMNINEKLQLEDGIGVANVQKFHSMVGGLLYLVQTRLDILYLVGIVSRYMRNPTKHHFGVSKRILRHIIGTIEFVSWYTSASNL